MFHNRLSRGIRRAGMILLIAMVLTGVMLPAAAYAAPASAQAAATTQQTGGFWYTVQHGDNLSRIAARYGSSVQAIKNANGLTTSVIQPGQVLFIPTGGGGGGGSCAQTHTVRRGETLSSIGRAYGVSVNQLVHANNIANPSRIYVGQRLCIPGGWNPEPGPGPWPEPGCPQFYHVQRGDTLSQIARWCGTTVQHLSSLNGIWNPSHIVVGQVIRIW